MIKGSEVLEMLCPAGGWIIEGNNFDNIIWVDDRPRCTKTEFEAGFEQLEAHKAQLQAELAAQKAAAEAKLAALGLNNNDLRALGL